MLRKIIRLFVFTTFILLTLISQPDYALSLTNTNTYKSVDFRKNVEEYIRFENIFSDNDTFDTDKLMQISTSLRDIARYLGSNSSANISIYSIDKDGLLKLYKITDIKKPDGTWNSFSVGHTLRLITQEITVIENKQQQPFIDLLVKDSDAQNKYRILIDVPLNQAVSAILDRFSNTQF